MQCKAHRKRRAPSNPWNPTIDRAQAQGRVRVRLSQCQDPKEKAAPTLASTDTKWKWKGKWKWKWKWHDMVASQQKGMASDDWQSCYLGRFHIA